MGGVGALGDLESIGWFFRTHLTGEINIIYISCYVGGVHGFAMCGQARGTRLGALARHSGETLVCEIVSAAIPRMKRNVGFRTICGDGVGRGRIPRFY